MNKFSVDYMDLQSKLSQKRAFRLSDVKEKIRKVAFDVVRFVDSDKLDDLWQIHRDGEDEYIVAMYDEEKTEKKAEFHQVANQKGWEFIQKLERMGIDFKNYQYKREIRFKSQFINSEKKACRID